VKRLPEGLQLEADPVEQPVWAKVDMTRRVWLAPQSGHACPSRGALIGCSFVNRVPQREQWYS
jgi:hypothetical protein